MGFYWSFYQGGERCITPIHRMAYVVVSNESSVPQFISGFSVEAYKDGKGWVAVESLPARASAGVYAAVGTTPLDRARPVKIRDIALDSKLDRTLGAHEVVAGWILLQIPAEAIVDTPNQRLRMTLLWGLGRSETHELNAIVPSKTPSTEFNALEMGEGTEDISRLKIVPVVDLSKMLLAAP